MWYVTDSTEKHLSTYNTCWRICTLLILNISFHVNYELNIERRWGEMTFAERLDRIILAVGIKKLGGNSVDLTDLCLMFFCNQDSASVIFWEKILKY